MKKLILSTALILMASAANAATAQVTVNGLVCAFCAKGIEENFKSREEVSKINVDLESKLVTIDFKDGKDIADTEMSKMLEDAGYNVVKIERK